MKYLFFTVSILSLVSCAEPISKDKYAGNFKQMAFMAPAECKEYVIDKAKSSGLKVDFYSATYAHRVHRNIKEVGILTYDYLTDATNYLNDVNNHCYPKYELSIPKEKLQNTAFQHHIYFGVAPKWIYYKDGEIRILYDKSELKP